MWWDRTIPIGKTWTQILKEALDSSRAMVVVWTAHSVRSKWVGIEASEGNSSRVL